MPTPPLRLSSFYSLLAAMLFAILQVSSVNAAPLLVSDVGAADEDGRVYWSSRDSIVRAKYDATEQTTLLDGVPLRNPIFNAAGTQMFGIGSDGVIRRANADGTALSELLTPGNNPISLQLDETAGKLYWIDDNSVRRANVDGSNVETLVDGLTKPRPLILDITGNQMFWANEGRVIQTAKLDGSALTPVYTPDPAAVGVACVSYDPVDEKLYWQLRESTFMGPIQRANVDGTGLETLPIEDVCPRLNADNRKLYWVLLGTDQKIQRSNLDGSNVQDIVGDVEVVNGLSFDSANNMLYWYQASIEDSVIRRASLDGGVAQDVVDLPTNPFGFALNTAAGEMVWELDGVLHRGNLDGSNPHIIVVGIRTAGSLALDLVDKQIFWTDIFSVRVADLDGKSPRIFWSTMMDSAFRFAPQALELDAENSKLYWITTIITDVAVAQTSKRVLFSANLDGTELETLVIEFSSPYAFDFVNQKLYGMQGSGTPGQTEIARINLDGTQLEGLGIFDNNFDSFESMTVDNANGKLYWTTPGTQGKIMQANLDGTEPEELITQINTVTFVTLDVANDKIYWNSQPIGETYFTERANLDGSERETFVEITLNDLVFDPQGLGTPLPPNEDEPALHLPYVLKD